MSVTTNATNALLAADLASGRASATFTGIVYKLNGSKRGRGAARQVYGDDLVHDTLVTGFKYQHLKARDLAKLLTVTLADLKAMAAKGYTAWDNPRRKDAQEVPVTLKDFQDALCEMIDSADLSSNGHNSATHDHVFESLKVNGEPVRGARVYVGPPAGKKAAAPKGTIYLSGLRVGRRVLEPAPNGPIPRGKSGAQTVAKRVIGKWLSLPSRRYVTYKLDPEAGFVLALGGAAAVAADDAGVTVDPTVVATIKESLTS